MHWDWKSFGNITGDWTGMWNLDGTINTGQVKFVSRSYAQAIAGNTTNMVYNTTTQQFTLMYNISITCTLPTEIYINEALNYPNGYTVTLFPPTAVTWSSPQRNSIFVYKTKNTVHGTPVVVTITAK